MFALPVGVNISICVLTLCAFFAAAYSMSYAFAAIRSHIPQQISGAGIYRFHVDKYSFDPSVPRHAQRTYVRSKVLGLVMLIGVLALVAQFKRSDALI